MECQECNREIPDDAVLCPYCGTKIKEAEMQQCQQCNREIPDDAALCPYCGTKVGEEVKEEEEQQQERIYLSDGGVTITNTRAVIAGKTYTMGLISSVQMVEIRPKRTWPIILLVVGIILLVFALASDPTTTTGEGAGMCVMIGLPMAVAGGVWLASLSNQYAVRVASASGETDALISKDEERIRKVIEALSQAITERG